jgi:WD40 repeat protein
VTAAHAGVRTPYKGLSAFDDTELDALLFFGRAHETEIVVANALASRLTVLYGPSGVGKSSLLRAGVARALRRLSAEEPVAVAYFNTWAGDPVTGIDEAVRGALTQAHGGDPGDAPGDLTDRIESWAAALGGELVVVLDQFEELFLYHDEGGSLLEVLPELVTRPGLRLNVVLGIRDDELAKLDVFKARIPGLFSNYLRLDLLDREAARAAIVGPLARFNELEDAEMTIEPELVEAILGEVAAGRIDPGLIGRGTAGESVEEHTRVETPYLQLVLEKLWEVERVRGSSVLRLATLTELGGAQRIVEDHLEHAMDALTPSQREVAAGMFDHLVTPSGAKIAHGVSDLASFAHVETAQIQPVLSSLSRERILRPTGENGHAGDRYEIYHDVLAGAVLAWSSKHEAETALERQHLDARRRQRRLAIVAGGSLFAFALMTALAVYALSQRSTARHQASLAHAGELLQRAQSEIATDPAKSVRDALASTRVTTSPKSEDVLRSGLLAMNALADLPAAGPAMQAAYSHDGTRVAVVDLAGEARIFTAPGGRLLETLKNGAPLNAVAWTPDGRTVATGARDGRIRLWSLAAPQAPVRVLDQGPGAWARTVAFSPDGRLLLTSGGAAARIWDAASGALLHRLPTDRPGRSASFSPDGSLIVTVENGRTARIWRTATGAHVATLIQAGEITSAAFGPNGTLVVTGSRDGTGRIWDSRTGRSKATLAGDPNQQVLTVAFSPTGNAVATGSTDDTARIWSTTGVLLNVIPWATTSVVAVAFAPDGQSLVVASSDGTATTTGGHFTQHLVGQGGAMRMAVFAPDATSVATAAGSTVRLWEPYGEPLLREIRSSPAVATALSFDPTGRFLASAGADGRVVVQRAHGGAPRTLLQTGTPVVATAWAQNSLLLAAAADGTIHLFPRGDERQTRTFDTRPSLVAADLRRDGAVVATAGGDGVVRLWKARTGSLIRAFASVPLLTAVALDPRGRLVAAASGNRVLMFDAATGKQRKVLVGHTNTVTGLAFSSDGRILASSSKDHDARLWNMRTMHLMKTLHRHAAFVSDVAFSADRRWLATAGPLKAGVWSVGESDLSGSFLYFVRGNDAPITSVAFSSRSWELATAARDGSISVYDCTLCGGLPQLESYARSRLATLKR